MRGDLARFRSGLLAVCIFINFTSSQSGFLGKRNAQPEAAVAQAKSEIKAGNAKVSTIAQESKTNFLGARFHNKVSEDPKAQVAPSVDPQAWFDVELGAEDAKLANTGKGTSAKVESMAGAVEIAETKGETQAKAKVATKVESESNENSDAKDAKTSNSDTASSGEVVENSANSADTTVQEVGSIENVVTDVESVKSVESITDPSADSVNIGAEIESVAAEKNTFGDDSVKDSEVDSSDIARKEDAIMKASSQKSLSTDFFRIEDGKVLDASSSLAAPDVDTHAGAAAEETEAEDDANIHEDDTMMAVAVDDKAEENLFEDFAHEHTEDQYDESAHDEVHEDSDEPDAHDHMDEDSGAEEFSDGDMEDDHSDDYSDSYDDDHDEDYGL